MQYRKSLKLMSVIRKKQRKSSGQKRCACVWYGIKINIVENKSLSQIIGI